MLLIAHNDVRSLLVYKLPVTGVGHETQSRAYTGAKPLRDKEILADASPTCVTEVREEKIAICPERQKRLNLES
jgi:hypothetical protein